MAVLYAALNVLDTYAHAVPVDELASVIAVGAKAARTLLGEQTSGFFSGAMAVPLLATVYAMGLIGPRDRTMWQPSECWKRITRGPPVEATTRGGSLWFERF